MAGAGEGLTSASSLPPRGSLLPEPDNPFHAHAAVTRKKAKTRATAAAASGKRRAAAAARAEKAQQAARDRAAAGVPPLRRQPSRQGAPARAITSTAANTSGASTVLPPEASPPLGPLTAAVPPPLAVIPTGSVILALAPTPAAATSAPLPCFAEGTAPVVIPTPTPGFAAARALEAAAPLALPPAPVTALSFETLAATPAAVYPPRPTSATAPIVLPAPTRPVMGAPVPALWDTGRLPEAAPTTALAMTSAPVLPGVGKPVLAAAAVASFSHARLVTPDTQTPASASDPTGLAVSAARGGFGPLPDAASGSRVGATSAQPPFRVVTAPSASAAASRTERAALIAEGRANPGSAASVLCMCSDKRGVKHLLVRIDELEAAGKKRRAATTMQLKDRSKRQTAASAHAADVKRILSEVLKAVKYVSTAIGHGASAEKELCRAVDERGAGPAEPAGAADRATRPLSRCSPRRSSKCPEMCRGPRTWW